MKMYKGSRSTTSPFLKFDQAPFYSAAFRSMSVTARCLLWELIGLYRGGNNGNLYLGLRDAAKLLGLTSDKPVTRSFIELRKHGFVVPVRPGSFHQKGGRATSWRLTFLDAKGFGRTNEWRNWKAQSGTKEAQRLENMATCDLRSTNPGLLDDIFDFEQVCNSIVGGLSDDQSRAAKMQTARISAENKIVQLTAHIRSHAPGPRASVEASQRVRRQALEWLQPSSRTQRLLSRIVQITEPKLSRFLHDPRDRRTLDQEVLDRLDRATRTHHLRIANLD